MLVVLKYQEMFLFEEIAKNIQFNSLFLGIRETSIISVHVRQVAFLFENWKKLFIYSNLLFKF